MDPRFHLTDSKIEPPTLSDDCAGACVTFEGRVRNHNEGRPVERLVYECYRELALNEGERILECMIERFGLSEAYAIHRVGTLEIGETAIWLQAIAPHRKSAFAACEWAMDEIKRSVPIWKHEHYGDGFATWLGSPEPERTAIHSRQLVLPEIGEAGQERLRASNVLVVGAGGLGCPAATYLACAGVGKVTVLDPDLVEESNLNRQPLYSVNDIGQSKAKTAGERLRGLAPGCTVGVRKERLDRDNAQGLVAGFDLVLDCTDDLAAKFAMNDACVRQGIPLVSASIHRWHGQLLVAKKGLCLRCLWNEQPPDGCVRTCEEEGVLGSTAGFFGVLQANEGLKLLLGIRSPAEEALLLADLRDLSVMHIARSSDPRCATCNGDQGTDSQEAIDLSFEEAARLQVPVYVDVRQEPRPPLPQSLAEIGDWRPGVTDSLKAEARPVVLVCQRGVTSSRMACALREEGWRRVFSLAGGVAGWSGK